MNAQYLVAKAIREGRLPRLNGNIACVDCGDPADRYDQRDYSKPLEVDPVCHKCSGRRGHGLSGPDVLTALNFLVPAAFHREFKVYATAHGISMLELLRECFRLVKEHHIRKFQLAVRTKSDSKPAGEGGAWPASSGGASRN